jgi:hypothetical protein
MNCHERQYMNYHSCYSTHCTTDGAYWAYRWAETPLGTRSSSGAQHKMRYWFGSCKRGGQSAAPCLVAVVIGYAGRLPAASPATVSTSMPRCRRRTAGPSSNRAGRKRSTRSTRIRELHRFKGAHSVQPCGESLGRALTHRVKDRNAHLSPCCKGLDHRAQPNSRIWGPTGSTIGPMLAGTSGEAGWGGRVG